MVLRTCFPNHCRDDQYGVVGRGRDAAIEAVEHAFLNPEIEFVCEADIENFYATIGEENGCITPENALYRGRKDHRDDRGNHRAGKIILSD